MLLKENNYIVIMYCFSRDNNRNDSESAIANAFRSDSCVDLEGLKLDRVSG